eukprot:278366_1
MARQVAIDLNRKNTIGTKLNYMSYVNNFWLYNLLHGWDVMTIDPEPQQMVFWLRHRIEECGTAVSLDQFQSAITWWCKNNLNYKPKFIKNGWYNECIETFKKIIFKNQCKTKRSIKN